MIDRGLRVDLALIDALVLVRHGLDDEEPILGVGLVENLEAVVSNVDKLAHGQQVRVSVAHPRNLEEREKGRYKTIA